MKTEFMFLHSDTLPFKAKITPRSQKHAKLIEELYRKLGVEWSLTINSCMKFQIQLISLYIHPSPPVRSSSWTLELKFPSRLPDSSECITRKISSKSSNSIQFIGLERQCCSSMMSRIPIISPDRMSYTLDLFIVSGRRTMGTYQNTNLVRTTETRAAVLGVKRGWCQILGEAKQGQFTPFRSWC